MELESNIGRFSGEETKIESRGSEKKSQWQTRIRKLSQPPTRSTIIHGFWYKQRTNNKQKPHIHGFYQKIKNIHILVYCIPYHSGGRVRSHDCDDQWTETEDMAGILAELEEEKMYKVRSQKKYGIIWELFLGIQKNTWSIYKSFGNW